MNKKPRFCHSSSRSKWDYSRIGSDSRFREIKWSCQSVLDRGDSVSPSAAEVRLKVSATDGKRSRPPMRGRLRGSSRLRKRQALRDGVGEKNYIYLSSSSHISFFCARHLVYCT